MKKYHIKAINVMMFISLYCLAFSTAHYQHFPSLGCEMLSYEWVDSLQRIDNDL